MNSYIRIVATVFPRGMVCLRNMGVDTLHKGETEDYDDDDNDNNNNDTYYYYYYYYINRFL
jgi:hypothetical protein